MTVLAAITAAFAVFASSAQTLPAIPPTSASTAPLAAAPEHSHGHHAYVTFNNGLLEVRANDSSLNVILRQIAQLTGMKISGGVADQRVFGTYGPADAGAVLATLLDGTGVNILVKESGTSAPSELILTPRVGNIPLPTPDSSEYNAEAAAEALPATPPPAPPAPARPAPAVTTVRTVTNNNNTTPFSTPPTAPQPWNNVNGSPSNTSPTAATFPVTHSVPISDLPQPSTTPPANGIVSAPNPPPAGTLSNPATSVTTVTTQSNGTTTTVTTTKANGTETPEEVYKQLLALQAAQQKAASGSGSSSGSNTTPAPQ